MTYEEQMKYLSEAKNVRLAILGGGPAHGCMKNRGRLTHVLISGKSLCGAKPRGESSGWKDMHGIVTCKRCAQGLKTRRLADER